MCAMVRQRAISHQWITLPDGISGFGHVLDTGFASNLALITGALPAQFGLRTAGIVDIQTKSGNALQQGGSVGSYGGSFGTLTPSFEYGGRTGTTEYFVTGRGFTSNLGIENPTDSRSAIHDRTYQGNFFSYTSTVLDAQTRLATIFGNTTNRFQIPNNPGQTPGFTAFGVSNFDSSLLNEKQAEQNTVGVANLYGFDLRLSAFSRYSTLHFIQTQLATLFSTSTSDVYAAACQRLQGDGIGSAMTYFARRFHGHRQHARQCLSTVLPLDAFGNRSTRVHNDQQQFEAQLGRGCLRPGRMADNRQADGECRTSVRPDVAIRQCQSTQPRQFGIQADRWHDFSAGYARYYPPPQAIAAPANIAPFANTTAQPDTFQQSPVQPERSHYFDAGVVQQITPNLQVGIDAYYKISKDLLDDGQFGSALILSGFNYETAENTGVELSATYKNGNFSAYGNLTWARQVAKNIVSNQYLFGADDLAYIANNYVSTDHAQQWTGSAGASYLWDGTASAPAWSTAVAAQRVCQYRPCCALRHRQFWRFARDHGPRRQAHHTTL